MKEESSDQLEDSGSIVAQILESEGTDLELEVDVSEECQIG